MTTKNPENELRRAMHDLPVRSYDPAVTDHAILVGSQAGRRKWLVGAALVLVVGLSSTIWWTNRAPQLASPLATPSASATSAPDSSSTPVASGSPTTPAADDSQEPSAPPTSESNPPPETSSSAPPTSAASPQSPAQPPGPTQVAVNPNDYRTGLGGAGGGWYFRSPSGNFACAITDAGVVGCQSTVLVSGMAACGDNPNWSAAMVTWNPSAPPAVKDCTSQGVFFAEGGTNTVLPYGSMLVIGEVTCSSGEDGIACYQTGAAGGFKISSHGILIDPVG